MSKNQILGTISLLALMMPGVAWASDECGPVNTASNPQTVTCTGAFASAATNGISYDANTLATNGPIELRIASTVSGAFSLNTTGNAAVDAVTLVGAPGYDATIWSYADSEIYSARNGLVVRTSGIGTAGISLEGTVNARALGLSADAGTDGMAIVSIVDTGVLDVEGSGAFVTGVSTRGAAGLVLTAGAITVDSSSGSGTATGIEFVAAGAGSFGRALNVGTLSVTSGSQAAVGFSINTMDGEGTVQSTGSVSVTSTSGPAIGAIFRDTGSTPGATSFANGGSFTVSSGGTATGLSVTGSASVDIQLATDEQFLSSTVDYSNGPSVFSVTGNSGISYGMLFTNIGGDVVINARGQEITVDGGAGNATGIAASGSGLLGGFTFHISDAEYSLGHANGDFTVTSAGGQATGFDFMSVSSAVDGAIDIESTGSSFLFTSDTSSARGVLVNSGTGFRLVMNSTPVTETAADFTVDAEGYALGVQTMGVTGEQYLSFGDSFSVHSETSDATGLSLRNGTDVTVAFHGTVDVSGATSAMGVSIEGATGDFLITSDEQVSVRADNGLATGIRMSGGTAQTVNLSDGLSVTGAGAQGIYLLANNSIWYGDVSLTLGGLLDVESTKGGTTSGIIAQLANALTINLDAGLNVRSDDALVSPTNNTAYGVQAYTIADQFTLTSGGAFEVYNGQGHAYGIDMSSAHGVDITLSDGMSVTAVLDGTSAAGIRGFGLAGDVSIETGDDFTVAAGGDATGILLNGGSGDVTLTVDGAFTVTGGTSAIGTNVAGRVGDIDISITGDMTSTSGGGAYGLYAGSNTGTLSFDLGGDLSVSGEAQTYGLSLTGGSGMQTVSIGGKVDVSLTDSTQTAFGVYAVTVGGIDLSVDSTFDTTSSGSAYGLLLVNTGATTVDMGDDFSVSSSGNNGYAYGTLLQAVSNTDVHYAGDFTITADSGYAYGLQANGVSGTLDLAVDGIFSVSGDGASYGLMLYGLQGVSTVDIAGSFSTVSDAGFAYGMDISLAGTGSLDLTMEDGFVVTGGNGATGGNVYGGAARTFSFQDVTVSADMGNAYGLSFYNGSGLTDLTIDGDLRVSSDTSSARGLAFYSTWGVDAEITGDAIVSGVDSMVIGAEMFSITDVAALTIGGVFTVTSDTFNSVLGINAGSVGHLDISVAGPMTVTNLGAGFVVGISAGGVADGVTINLDDAMTTSSLATAWGMQLNGIGGATEINVADLLSVDAGTNAYGILATGTGAVSTIDITMGNGVTVHGGDYAAALDARFAATTDMDLTGDVLASSLNGAADGILFSDSGATTVTLSDNLSVTGFGNVRAMVSSIASSFDVTVDGDVTATSDNGAAAGVIGNLLGDVTLTLGSALTVQGKGDGLGIWFDGLDTLSLDVAGTVSVTSTDGHATGVLVESALGDITAELHGLNVSAAGEANGIRFEGEGAIDLTDSGTITVSGLTGLPGTAVYVEGLSSATAAGAITVDLNSVVATGNVNGVSILNAHGSVTADIQSVSAAIDDGFGVAVSTLGTNALDLTIGSVDGTAHSGGVTLVGDEGIAVYALSENGDVSVVNHGTVSMTGNQSAGILGGAMNQGSVSIESWNVVVTGDETYGIYGQSNGGDLTISAVNVSMTGEDTVAIAASSNTGDVTVNVADGGVVQADYGIGVGVQTNGAAAINIGSSADTAQVAGGAWGVWSMAGLGTTLNIHGIVTGGGGAAIHLEGGASTINNLSNTVIGYVELTDNDDTFNNAGTWDAYGDSDFGGGDDVLNNSGYLYVPYGATSATTVAFQNLETLNNSGTISLSQGASGHTGDILDLGDADFVGVGATGKLVIDVNLGGATVGSSAAQSADMLYAGSLSGSTMLVLNNISDGVVFNPAGIVVAQADDIAANALLLAPGSTGSGFTQYALTIDGNTIKLLTLPGGNSFSLVRAGAEAQRFWRRSADAWGEQTGLFRGEGPRLWMQMLGGRDTEESRPTLSVSGGGSSFAFNPNLDIRDSVFGVEAGLDYGVNANFGVGVVFGYADQNGDFTETAEELNIDGLNLGAYARVNSGAFFARMLVKVDFYSVDYKFASAVPDTSFDGTTWGMDLRTGFHAELGSGVFVEPTARIAWTSTSLDGFTGVAGVNADYDTAESAFGEIGMRAGLSTQSGAWTVSPYVGAYYRGEMTDGDVVNIASGSSVVRFQDDAAGGHGRFEGGISATNAQGLTLFGTVEGTTGSVHGIGGRAGVSFRF